MEEAIACHGTPEIFNTDQGSQFTNQAFTDLLKDHGIAISMDGKGCWHDNVFIERLWKSVKYEEVYLHAYDSVNHTRNSLGRYLETSNPSSRSLCWTETIRFSSLPNRDAKERAASLQPFPVASFAASDQPRSGTTRTSTRRFWARPCSVELSAIGIVLPKPTISKRSRIRPWPTR